MSELLSVQQVAELLNLSAEGVRHRLRTGALQGTRVSARVWVISREEAERALAEEPKRKGGRPPNPQAKPASIKRRLIREKKRQKQEPTSE